MGTVFLDTLNRVAPVFLVIFLGVLLNKLHFFAEQTKADIVKLVFYVGTPCLIVKEIAASDLTQVMDGPFILYVCCIVAALVGLMWLLCFFIKDPARKGAVIQLGFRSNFAIVGMPLAMSLLDADGVALTAVALSFTVLLYNVFAVLVLSYYGGKERRLLPVFLNVIRNPLIIGVVIGLLLSLFKVPLTEGQAPEKILSTLGSIASSMGLLIIGANITLKGFNEDRFYIFYSVLLRNVVAPLFVVGVAVLLGFRGNELMVLTIMSAAPSAVNCFVMAKKMGVSANISAFGVSFTSIASLLSMVVCVFVLRTTGLV